MSYRLSGKAEEDLISIYVDGVQEFGVARAEAYHAELEELFEILAETPELARLRKEIRPPVRVHPHRAHIVIYSVDERRDVFIVRIRHGREDWVSEPLQTRNLNCAQHAEQALASQPYAVQMREFDCRTTPSSGSFTHVHVQEFS